MAGNLERFVCPEHPRTRAELVLALTVVEPCITSCAKKEEAVARADREGLRDTPGNDAERLCSRVDCRGRSLDLDER